MVLGGDGRWFNKEACQIIIKLAAGNGVKKLYVGRNGYLCTPAASAVIRARKAFGGFIMSASHNPGGPDEDWGIKFNYKNGEPAPESLTDKIYGFTKSVSVLKMAEIPHVDITKDGVTKFGNFEVEVIDPVADYLALFKARILGPAIGRTPQQPVSPRGVCREWSTALNCLLRAHVREHGKPSERTERCERVSVSSTQWGFGWACALCSGDSCTAVQLGISAPRPPCIAGRSVSVADYSSQLDIQAASAGRNRLLVSFIVFPFPHLFPAGGLRLRSPEGLPRSPGLQVPLRCPPRHHGRLRQAHPCAFPSATDDTSDGQRFRGVWLNAEIVFVHSAAALHRGGIS